MVVIYEIHARANGNNEYIIVADDYLETNNGYIIITADHIKHMSKRIDDHNPAPLNLTGTKRVMIPKQNITVIFVDEYDNKGVV